MIGRLVGCLGVAVVITLGLGAYAHSQQYKAGGLVIEQPWVRATPGGAKVAGGYMTIRNGGSEPDRLIGGSTPLAGRLEVHEMRLEDGIMRMREIRGGLEIAPGQTVELKPGGYHAMLMDLNAPLRQGETLKGQLRFEKAGMVEVEFKVEAVGAPHPAGKH
jgi:copper(I)-binding protein